MSLTISSEGLPGPKRGAIISLAGWTCVAALFSLQRLYALAAKGVPPVWDHLVLEIGVVWGTWALLTPLIFLIVLRLPLPSEHSRRVLLHVPIGIMVGLLHSFLVAAITPLFLWRPSLAPIRDMFAGRLASTIASETLIYFLAAAVLYASVYASQSRHRQLEVARAEASLARARQDMTHLEDSRQQLSLLLDEVKRDKAADTLAVPMHDGMLKVPVGSIDWLQAEDNYVRIYTAGRSHLVRATLSALEKRLAVWGFIRTHRSAMVNRARIAGLRRVGSDHYAVLLTNGALLRVSRAYRKAVLAAVGTPLTPQ
jgi:DNA-binding LytR/AlgR family response regulator